MRWLPILLKGRHKDCWTITIKMEAYLIWYSWCKQHNGQKYNKLEGLKTKRSKKILNKKCRKRNSKQKVSRSCILINSLILRKNVKSRSWLKSSFNNRWHAFNQCLVKFHHSKLCRPNPKLQNIRLVSRKLKIYSLNYSQGCHYDYHNYLSLKFMFSLNSFIF